MEESSLITLSTKTGKFFPIGSIEWFIPDPQNNGPLEAEKSPALQPRIYL
jgi:hypothetical protein